MSNFKIDLLITMSFALLHWFFHSNINVIFTFGLSLHDIDIWQFLSRLHWFWPSFSSMTLIFVLWPSAIYIEDWGKVNRAMHSDHQRSPHQGPIVWAWSAEYMTLIWGVWAQVHDIDIWRFSAQDDIIDIEGSAWHDYIDVRALRRLHRYRGVSWPDYIDICTFQ